MKGRLKPEGNCLFCPRGWYGAAREEPKKAAIVAYVESFIFQSLGCEIGLELRRVLEEVLSYPESGALFVVPQSSLGREEGVGNACAHIPWDFEPSPENFGLGLRSASDDGRGHRPAKTVLQ